MTEIWMFLGKYINPAEEPRQWLPIVVLIIAWLLSIEAIGFLRKYKFLYRLQISNQEQLQQLRHANLKIVFLANWLIFFAAATLFTVILI